MAERTGGKVVSGNYLMVGWMPVLVGVLLCVLFGLIVWNSIQREDENLHTKIHAEADNLASHINSDLRNRISTLQRQTKRWAIRKGVPKKEFLSDARAYISDVPGFQALEWVDKDWIVRWIAPLEGNERARNLNLGFEDRRRMALQKARDTRVPTISEPVDLVQGGKGFLIYFPLYVDDQFDGIILAVFRINEWLDYVFSFKELRRSDDFLMSVYFDNILIFQQKGWNTTRQYIPDTISEAKVLDRRLSILVRPTENYIKRNTSMLPKLTTIFGALVSVLVAFALYLLQKSFLEQAETRSAKAALEIESRERKKTADELQNIVSRLDMATKAGGIGIWTWDIATNILVWNERMYELYDVPPDVSPTYDTWHNAIHPDDVGATDAMLESAIAGKSSFNTEFRIIHSNGSMRYIGAAARAVRDSSGKPRQMTGINWDVTLRRQAEEQIKKSEEQVRLLLNSTAEGIYGIDLDGNCTFANPSVLKMLGYVNMEQLLGRHMHQLIHHSSADGRLMPIEQCHINRALREGAGVYREDEVFWKSDNTRIQVEYWSYPQMVNGKVAGAVVTFNDITERKQIEKALADERKRLANILEGTNVGTWEWNVVTGEVVFNERWADIIGYSLAELEPLSINTWTMLFHP
ncbi:MAG: PAS domain S-box protein, partial [Syntrophorhabdus sp.]